MKFCVKLWKNKSDTCAVLSQAYEREAMKNQVSSGMNDSRSKVACRNHKWRYCSSISSISSELFSFESFHKTKESTKLIICKYWSGYMKLCVEKCLNFGPTIWSSTITMLHLTKQFLAQKSITKMEHPP
jgi:hypothetical protein